MEEKCDTCNYINEQSANFCVKCGNKIKKICNCWIKKEPYNCGSNKCPSYKLFKKNIIEGK